MKILLSLDGTDVAFILFFIVAVVGMCLLYQRNQRVRLAAAAGGVSLRKAVPYLLFLVLGVLFLFGEPLAHWLSDLAYGAHPVPEPSMALRTMAALGNAKAKALLDHWQEINASTAQIAADAKVGGWVPVGTATSKIILAVSFYVLSYIIPWVMQQVTHPAPTKWAKHSYTSDFEALPVERKFEANSRLSLNQSIRFACSVIAACLIN